MLLEGRVLIIDQLNLFLRNYVINPSESQWGPIGAPMEGEDQHIDAIAHPTHSVQCRRSHRISRIHIPHTTLCSLSIPIAHIIATTVVCTREKANSKTRSRLNDCGCLGLIAGAAGTRMDEIQSVEIVQRIEQPLPLEIEDVVVSQGGVVKRLGWCG